MNTEKLLEETEQLSLSVCHLITGLSRFQRAGLGFDREIKQLIDLRAVLYQQGQDALHDLRVDEQEADHGET
jgi:hypothetical protein